MAQVSRSLCVWLALIALFVASSERLARAQNSISNATRKSIAIAPATATVRAGSARKFYAQISGGFSSALVWRVNGVKGGALATGTIAADGTYTAGAPAELVDAVAFYTPQKLVFL